MRKVILALALTLVATVIGGQDSKAQDVIRFATEGAYPPLNQLGPDGKLTGFEIDLGAAMCARINRKCELSCRIGTG
jgi:ABC-type amino acid transport substrate-binding protein